MRVPGVVCTLSILLFASITSVGCKQKDLGAPPDHPRLTPAVRMQDVTFYSNSLKRNMPYRVVLPAKLARDEKLPAIYLLHGGGGGFHDWTNYSDVARFAEHGFILVMPEGSSSYYVNSAEHPEDRYEDYITDDLIKDVETRFPAISSRQSRAIAGVSMGGYGAVTLAMKHPELFAFAAGLSPAVDVPSRPFSIKRIGQWRHHSSIFGPWGSKARHDNNPFVLTRTADPLQVPYLFLTCGEQEGLLPSNRQFAALLKQRHFRYEFYTTPGGHNWNQWNQWLGKLFQSLEEHVKPNVPESLAGMPRQYHPVRAALFTALAEAW